MTLNDAELAELTLVFDMQWEADQRAIKAWQAAHPERPNVWPDRCDMVVWLMEHYAQSEARALKAEEALREILKICQDMKNEHWPLVSIGTLARDVLYGDGK
jgi:hypothetical protein